MVENFLLMSRLRKEGLMKLKNKKGLWLVLLGVLVTVTAYAATPATKEYVDEKIAILQAEITQIINGG